MESKTDTKKDNHTLQGFLNFSNVLKNLKKALNFAARYDKSRVYTLFTIAALTAVIPYVQNGLFGRMVDVVLSYKDQQTDINSVVVTVALLIVATAIPNVLDLIRNFVEVNYRFNLVRNLDLHFNEKISTLDIATIEGTEYQELVQKANERGTMSIYSFLAFCMDNLSNLVGVIVSFVILGFLDQTLLFYAFFGALPALYVQLRYGKDIYWIWDLNANNRRKYFNRRQHFWGTTNLTEMKVYQLSKRFLFEIKKILNSFDDELKGAERSKLAWELFALATFAVFSGFALWRVATLTLLDILPIGQMLFAYTTYRGFKGTLGQFFRRVGSMTEFSNYSSYWFEIDALEPKIKDNKSSLKVDYKNNPPKIEFKNVSFRYNKSNNNYALKDMSFVINPGEKIAIVGLSGAGKTTLIKLLCRVYDPETGYILINDTDLRNISLEDWQKQLAVLFQDYASYEFTAKEAIAIGDSSKPLDMEKVLLAAKMAKADNFIERLPKKYDQLLWKGFEDGVELSKGERQRMALARVLYRESPVTVLDEPTASVDALAELEIFETLEQLPADRTVILISHRFSTVKNADNIIVIEYGQIVEEGKHATLLERDGKYAELYKAQADSYK
ncbi:MAG: ABC transporter ATP-binding protein [Patescibacteria group bacterium]